MDEWHRTTDDAMVAKPWWSGLREPTCPRSLTDAEFARLGGCCPARQFDADQHIKIFVLLNSTGPIAEAE